MRQAVRTVVGGEGSVDADGPTVGVDVVVSDLESRPPSTD